MLTATNPIKNNWCTPQYTITSPTLSYDPQCYTVGTAALTITVPSFTIPLTCSDISWTYSAYQVSSSNTLIVLDSSFISNVGETFTVYTTDDSKGGTYTIELNAPLANDQT